MKQSIQRIHVAALAVFMVTVFGIHTPYVFAEPTTAPDLTKPTTAPANTLTPSSAPTRTTPLTVPTDLKKDPTKAQPLPSSAGSSDAGVGNFEVPNIECRLKVAGDCADLNALLLFVAEWLIGIAGTIFFFMILYGAMRYLTGAGDESQTEKGKKTMLNAGIGLVLVLASWAIIELVIKQLGG